MAGTCRPQEFPLMHAVDTEMSTLGPTYRKQSFLHEYTKKEEGKNTKVWRKNDRNPKINADR